MVPPHLWRMDKEDGRKLSRQAQHERRKQAVRLHRRGMAIKEHCPGTGSGPRDSAQRHQSDPSRWHPSPGPQTNGRAGEQRRLTPEQELHIQRQICKHRPEQLKPTFALWTRAAVLLLVLQEFGIGAAHPHHGRVPQALGLHAAKPITRAYEQRPEAVKAWLDEQYPEIAERQERKR